MKLVAAVIALLLLPVVAQTGEQLSGRRELPEPRVLVRELQPAGWTAWQSLTARRDDVPGVRSFSSSLALQIAETTAVFFEHDRWSYTVTNLMNGQDRLLTVAIAVPLFADGLPVTWYDDIYSSRPVTDSGCVTVIPARAVASPDGGLNTSKFGGKGDGGYGRGIGTGSLSPYPFACVSDSNDAYALAVDIGLPVPHRFVFRRNVGLTVEFDVALSPRQRESPNAFRVSLYGYRVDPAWGFRDAAAKYYSLFPQYFVRRLRREGIWMPFTPINEVQGWEDFGFAIHETSHELTTLFKGAPRGVAEVDRALGVTSFQYTEPWDIQIPVDPQGLTYAALLPATKTRPEYAAQILRSAAEDEHGQWIARLISAPWFKPPWAISYTTSAAPDASRESRYSHVRSAEIDTALARAFDGIYFDSLEFFWHYDLDYHPEHVAASRFPLTFSSVAESPRPAVWNYSSQIAMLQTVCGELHARGKLSMGNGFSWLPFAVAHLDILGTEFSWFMKPKEKQTIAAFRRTACGHKPVVLLLNEGLYSDDFLLPPYDGYRQYFEESLFYGMYPSFFSADASNDPYWKKPEAYNIGRPFFAKYIPLIQEINRQGWQPVTYARVSDPRVRVERFYRPGGTVVYFTLRNFSDQLLESIHLEIDDKASSGRHVASVEEIIHRQPLEMAGHSRLTLSVAPRTTLLLQCGLDP